MKPQRQLLTEIRIYALLIIITLFIVNCNDINRENMDPVTPDKLEEGFINPPDSVKPWVYWYWISDNNTNDGITKDLEAMARIGIGEALIGNIGYEEMPYGKISILSEEWWQLIEHAIKEGKRLGVNIGMFNCPGWSQSGGPWVKPAESMRYLVISETEVEGGRKIVQKLLQPKEIFQDVKVLAFPVPENDHLTIASLKPEITTIPELENPARLADGDTGTVCLFTKAGNSEKITIDLATKDLFTARSLILHPARIPFAADIDLQVPYDGIFQSVKKFRYDRSNPRVNVGPMPYGALSIAIPEVTARSFRIIMSNFNLSNYLTSAPNKASNAGLAEITLSAAPRVERFIEKQLGKMCQTPFPLWDEYMWGLQAETGNRAMKINPEEVIDLSANISDDTLTWNAPAGKWLIMRLGATPSGTRNAAAAPHAMGLEVDKMNREHLKKHFDAYIGELLKRIPAGDRTALKHVVLDSYEQGSENWTEGLAEDFKGKFGYDLVQWLPVLSGRIVGSADQSNKFLWDLRRIIADRIAYNYVGAFRDICQEKRLRIWLENYGHWGFPSEFLMYGGQSHDIAGEFWNEGELGNIECRAASSAAHIYGKRRVSAESFTSAGLAYQRYPAMLKKRGDWSYTEGINQVILHLYIHQPYEGKTPGINAWFGTEFNRKNTWFDQAKKWIDYQRRCMFMLQRGLPVNDICYFIGEDVPKMTGTRIPELPKGYSFDYINAEVIMNRLSVQDGNLVLPDGMSYRVMVLPPVETMRPELLRKIKQLVDRGAIVLGPPPDRSPSLQNFPSADEEVKSLSAGLWGDTGSEPGKSKKYGKGMILNVADFRTALNQIGLLPDVSVPENIPLLWIHRRLKDVEIYFITNQSGSPISFEAKFRVTGKKPEFCDATSGMMRDLPAFSQNNKLTTVPLKLDAFGSAFILFRKRGDAISDRMELNFPEPKTLVTIATPWEVSFDKAWGGPESPVKMTTLEDWSKNNDERIRYYSGTVIYKNTFVLDEIPLKDMLYINLGDVKLMAEVKINGQEAGGVWTSPWQVNITNLVKPGENSLEVQVVNNWVNRLIGDSNLPEKDRKTWINVNQIKPDDQLQSSGLMGPVSVVSVRY
jgi:hypothetical protein